MGRGVVVWAIVDALGVTPDRGRAAHIRGAVFALVPCATDVSPHTINRGSRAVPRAPGGEMARFRFSCK